MTRPEVCVGAIVFDDQRQLLLIKRGRGAAVGQWSVPGGRVEQGETLADALEREVLEETGISVICGRFLGWVERITEDHHFVIMDFLAEPVRPMAPLRAGDDASDVAYIDTERLPEYALVDGLLDFLTDHGCL